MYVSTNKIRQNFDRRTFNVLVLYVSGGSCLGFVAYGVFPMMISGLQEDANAMADADTRAGRDDKSTNQSAAAHPTMRAHLLRSN